MWVELKKLFKFWILKLNQNIKNQQKGLDPLSRAFNLWKDIFEKKKESMMKLLYYRLVDRLVIVWDTVDDLQTQCYNGTQNIKLLNNQNKVWVDNTVSGQRMAFSSWEDKYGGVVSKSNSKRSNLPLNNDVVRAFQTWLMIKREKVEKAKEIWREYETDCEFKAQDQRVLFRRPRSHYRKWSTEENFNGWKSPCSNLERTFR